MDSVRLPCECLRVGLSGSADVSGVPSNQRALNQTRPPTAHPRPTSTRSNRTRAETGIRANRTRANRIQAETGAVTAVRLSLLALVVALAAIVGPLPAQILPAALLSALAATATIADLQNRYPVWATAVEAAASGLIVVLASPRPAVFLPYLAVPVIAAYLLRNQEPVPSVAGQDTYHAAHELLSQLRDVARALPTGLDEISLGQSLLEQLRPATPFDRAALYTISNGGRPVQLTLVGADRLDWRLDADLETWDKLVDELKYVTMQRSLSESQPGNGNQPASADQPGWSALFPMRLHERGIGIVAIESGSGGWSVQQLDAAQRSIDSAALRIDSGLLFSDVRAFATVAERRRMAREIHDGIAQEIASLGYEADDIAAAAADPRLRERIQQFRQELSRVVNELRLSIFDLRSDVAPDTGLGAALSSYVRQVGTTSGLTVHMVMDESGRRLGVGAETELMRIAQEAITNVRRHSEADNLWVTCRINPPNAFLRVADDGIGLRSPRIDSYGLEIMRERAARLGARLDIRDRAGSGTVVEITLGAAPNPPRAQPPIVKG